MEYQLNWPCCPSRLRNAANFRRLQNELRKRLSHTRRFQPVCWKFVLPVLYKLHRFDARTAWETIRFILGLFDQHECTDQSVIGEVLRFAIIMFGNKPVSPGTDHAHFHFHPRNPYTVYDRPRPILPTLMKIPYGNTTLYSSIHFDVTFLLIKNGKDELLSACLRHGVMCLPLQDTRTIWEEIINALEIRLIASYPHLKLRDTLNIFQDIENLNPEKRRRLLMVFKVVDVILRSEMHQTPIEKSLKCLRMEYETIPEPAITSKEVEFFIKLILEERFHGFVPQMCSIYVCKYPESAGPLAPRSLLHLSRYQVRQSLRATGSLPYGVQALDIPETLKEYILVEWYRKL